VDPGALIQELGDDEHLVVESGQSRLRSDLMLTDDQVVSASFVANPPTLARTIIKRPGM
jgi:hypothetical protein